MGRLARRCPRRRRSLWRASRLRRAACRPSPGWPWPLDWRPQAVWSGGGAGKKLSNPRLRKWPAVAAATSEVSPSPGKGRSPTGPALFRAFGCRSAPGCAIMASGCRVALPAARGFGSRCQWRRPESRGRSGGLDSKIKERTIAKQVFPPYGSSGIEPARSG